MQSDDGFHVMAYDVPPECARGAGDTPFVAVPGNDATTLTRYWEGLAVGASIVQQLASAGLGFVCTST